MLLDQKVCAGVGNAFADEALFRARLHPREPADSLDRRRVRRLHHSIVEVLREAVHVQGSSLRGDRSIEEALQAVSEHLHVYRREGGRCHRRCGGTGHRITVGGRATRYCPRCQKHRFQGR